MMKKSANIPASLRSDVLRCLNESLARANAYLHAQHPVPVVNFHQRGTTAGTARLADWEIRLNKTLLLENGLDFIHEVVPHELAHLLVFKHFGRVAPHGKEWKWMMSVVLNQTPKRTHSFSVQSVQQAQFLYQCACQTHPLSLIRHNRAQKKKQTYLCRLCHQPLRWIAKPK